MTAKRKIPSLATSFLSRQKLPLTPSKNLVEKFQEFYNIEKNSNKATVNKPIDYETAEFFLRAIFENIIYVLDCGYNFAYANLILFCVRVSDYSRMGCKVFAKKGLEHLENTVKISIQPNTYSRNRIKKYVNKDNPEYVKFLKSKEQQFNKIKRYYRELYGKENEWWQELP